MTQPLNASGAIPEEFKIRRRGPVYCQASLSCLPLLRRSVDRWRCGRVLERAINLTRTQKLTSLLIRPRCEPAALRQLLWGDRGALPFATGRPRGDVLLYRFLQSFFALLLISEIIQQQQLILTTRESCLNRSPFYTGCRHLLRSEVVDNMSDPTLVYFACQPHADL